jgi:hypothetical protein
MTHTDDYEMHMKKWNVVVVTAANGLHTPCVLFLSLRLKNKPLNHQVLTADRTANGGNVPVDVVKEIVFNNIPRYFKVPYTNPHIYMYIIYV